jgi:O-6-methylguanine DNA methyltransferase
MQSRERILRIVKKIPEGKVASYTKVARLAKTSPRAVGAVMRANRDASVPCHRVVASDGSLHGFNRGLTEKKRLLEKEGIRIVGTRIIMKPRSG